MHKSTWRTWFFCISAVLLALTLSAENHIQAAESELSTQLAGQIALRGNVPVIVELHVPGYEPETMTADVGIASAQAAAIADAQQAVLGNLAAYPLQNIKTYEFTPYLAVTLSQPEALVALINDPLVIHIQEDIPVPPQLSGSVPLIGANNTQFLFAVGAGRSIAILDTGVDRFHPALAGKVTAGACFSTTNAGQGATSLCTNGVASSTNIASSGACPSFISGCDHGTHVAGIAAGVATGASIVAVQVFSRFTDTAGNTPCANVGRTSPCTLSYTSDQMSALTYVFNVRNTENVASVNMSLGGGNFTAACNSDSRRANILNLRNAGIPVVISAGNSSFRNAMGAPACITEAFTVAASDKNDVIASYSNISNLTNVIAPGSDIFAPIYNPNYDSKNGTSMAAPHVAGAFAVMRALAPNATAAQLETHLTNTGVNIFDNRTGGTVTKRRINVYHAFCNLVTCDSDDYRTIGLNQTLTGAISPTGDKDYYYYFGAGGQRLTTQLIATSGTLNPFLEIYSPQGVRIAFNNSGGSGNNSLINNLFLPTSGRYLIVAQGTGTGGYQLSTSSQPVQLNPVPRIDRISPTSATATSFGSDFWVAIYGQNFQPTSQVRWNGQLRTMFYSRPDLIYIRVRGSDIGYSPFPPRLAFVSVLNPAPGGGTSNSYPFNVRFPFLGESNLLAPEPDAVIETGIKTSFAISWTAPITATTWRSMQGMDLRLRNENNEVAAWVRVVEQPGDGNSYFRLLNATESQPDTDNPDEALQGLPGEERTLVISDTVILHLEESTFSGSGLTAIMTPVLEFGPNATGIWNVEFRVDRKYEEGDEGDEEEQEDFELVQDDDVLGTVTIVPAECPIAVTDGTLSGATDGTPNTDYIYDFVVAPLAPTQPITLTWAPEPVSGQGTTSATYNWNTPGIHVVAAFAENCGGFAADVLEVRVPSAPTPDLAIGKRGPATVLPGGVISYTLTVSNTGAVTATNLVISDTVPSGINHPEGFSTVSWLVPELSPYTGTYQAGYTVTVPITATGVITNYAYGVAADDGYTATGTTPVVTHIVQVQQPLDNETAQTVASGPTASESDIVVEIPAGAVFEAVLLSLDQLAELPYALPEGQQWLGVAFRLGAAQDGRTAPDLRLNEVISFTLRYATAQSAAQSTQPSLGRWDGDEWNDADIECAATSEPGEVFCTADGALMGTYALFAEVSQTEEYTLDVTTMGEGSVSIDPDQESYPDGTAILLTATPAAGWSFTGWSGDASGTTNPLEVTISANTSITATFMQDEEEPGPDMPRILVPNVQRGTQ